MERLVTVSPHAAMALPGQPGPLFSALEAAFQATIGHRLFTIMLHDAAAQQNARIHTSHPREYPVGGRKPVIERPWTTQVLRQGRPFIGNDADAIRATFADHELILSLGCESVLNLPVRWDGRTLGTVNLLHQAGHFTEAHAQAGMALAALAAPTLLTVPMPPA
jgi:GAF domain-containing protein